MIWWWVSAALTAIVGEESLASFDSAASVFSSLFGDVAWMWKCQTQADESCEGWCCCQYLLQHFQTSFLGSHCHPSYPTVSPESKCEEAEWGPTQSPVVNSHVLNESEEHTVGLPEHSLDSFELGVSLLFFLLWDSFGFAFPSASLSASEADGSPKDRSVSVGWLSSCSTLYVSQSMQISNRVNKCWVGWGAQRLTVTATNNLLHLYYP